MLKGIFSPFRPHPPPNSSLLVSWLQWYSAKAANHETLKTLFSLGSTYSLLSPNDTKAIVWTICHMSNVTCYFAKAVRLLQSWKDNYKTSLHKKDLWGFPTTINRDRSLPDKSGSILWCWWTMQHFSSLGLELTRTIILFTTNRRCKWLYLHVTAVSSTKHIILKFSNLAQAQNSPTKTSLT
jgi:hypothetical protein